MLPDIDFRAIRPWKGSRNGGFEELCCQLYSLEPPGDQSKFIRKEGAGGDAGVESVWTLSDGQVHGLQTKYFLDELGSSQWAQMDKSVRTALDKYSSLSRYVMCLPRDLADRRRKGETSQREQWDARVAKWSAWARAQGADVEFVYWGASELGERLSRDDSRYSGRILYWFGAKALTSEWFNRKFENAKANLGKRYTPNANVELPIRSIFDGLCRTPVLAHELARIRARIRKEEDLLASHLRGLERDPEFTFDVRPLEQALSRLDSLLFAPLPGMWEQIPAAQLTGEAKAAVTELSSLSKYVDELALSPGGQTDRRSDRSFENVSYFARRLDRELGSAIAFFQSRQMAAANSPRLLVDGDAGMGKSHLLADIAEARLEQGWPTVLLLGQHVSGGNPWDAFLSDLDLRSHSVDDVLGALDAAGQAAGARSLLLVDAINEGGGRRVWRDHVAGFLATVAQFPHVAVALTCRTTYVKGIFTEGVSTSLVRVTHRGFEGHESKAAAIYLDQFGIARPNTPLLSPEFSNPLFLRTCCEALNRQGKTSFPRGVRGVKNIFELYVASLDAVLEDRIDVDPTDGIGGAALRRLADAMSKNSRAVVPRDEAKRLLSELYPSSRFSESLLHHLVAEGALATDLEYPAEPDGEPHEIVRFTFERFSDHFITEHLLETYVNDNIEAAVEPDAPLCRLLTNPHNWHLRGVVEALAVQIPERYGRELIALLDGKRIPFDLETGFLESIIWRDPSACNNETVEWLVKTGGSNRGEHLWDTVLHVCAEPDHPFNADRLHRNLLDLQLPVRDETWSVYLAQHYWDEEDGEPETIARTLVRWAWDSRGSGADDETARLCCIALTWFFTTSNRTLRDHATKALVSLLCERLHLAPPLIDAFESVNDPYVIERLYCGIYGAVLQGAPDSDVSAIASAVYRSMFERGSPLPHVLLRDYARGIIEYSLHRGCLPPEVDLARVRPPYASDPWPLEIPTDDDVKASEYDAIRSSVLSMGDFGRYVMGDSSDWSITPLNQARPATHRDRVEAFRKRVAADPDPAVAEAFERLTAAAAPESGDNRDSIVLLNLFRNLRWDDAIGDLPGREIVEEKVMAIEEAEAQFVSLLPESEQAYFREEILRYLEFGSMAHLADRPIRFDIMAERRWVWRRAHELGWSSDRFESFERLLSGGRQERRIERIGKKYQWIAWHELQARLSDHLYFVGDGWGENPGSVFEGPWQIRARDIDPSLLIRGEERNEGDKPVWWRPAHIEHPDESTEERVTRLWSDDGFPELKKLLRVQDPEGREWLVLDGFSMWREEGDDRDPRPRRETWVRIESFFVAASDMPAVLTALEDTELTQPNTLSNRLDFDSFLGEYPWHTACPSELDEWNPAPKPTPFQPIPVPYLIPTVEYLCEPGRDQSIENRIDLRLPNRLLRDELNLRWGGGMGTDYFGEDGRLVFFDPTPSNGGPAATLVDRDKLLRMIKKLGLALIWRIGGEKGLYGSRYDHDFHGRQILSAVFFTDDDSIEGKEWRLEQRAHA